MNRRKLARYAGTLLLLLLLNTAYIAAFASPTIFYMCHVVPPYPDGGRDLCPWGLGKAAGAGREQAITANPRLLSPGNCNQRQPIHDHESIPPLAPAPKPKPPAAAAGGSQ